ncbi:MAG TPA: stringent starvation protein A [Gammaproteobacteria bacterium]|nr:stringent starvation protein A [Gammaproteobacteria bacterium]
MAQIANRRSVMTLYSGKGNAYSHMVRVVLSEKGINHEVVDVDLDNPPEDLIDLNPYNEVPTLVDRDLVLYDANTIMEYLDERFPHPPLMPVDPVSRAQNRQMRYRIQRDWYTAVDRILASSKDAETARKELRESLVAVSPVFEQKPFFLSEEFSLVDAAILPLLWRLPQLGIEIPAQAKGLNKYMQNMFERESFINSLTETEREIRFPD